jgi:hypothetical protein
MMTIFKNHHNYYHYYYYYYENNHEQTRGRIQVGRVHHAKCSGG